MKIVRSRKKYYDNFKSGLEGVVSDYLRRFAPKYGYDVRYETERLEFHEDRKYTPDFVMTFEDGHKRYIEAKGYFDYQAQRKMHWVKKCHPEKDIRLLFLKNNPLRKGSGMKYTDWAEREGYPSAVRDIPDAWLTREG